MPSVIPWLRAQILYTLILSRSVRPHGRVRVQLARRAQNSAQREAQQSKSTDQLDALNLIASQWPVARR